jgi:hypothetical protein
MASFEQFDKMLAQGLDVIGHKSSEEFDSGREVGVQLCWAPGQKLGCSTHQLFVIRLH